MGYGRTSASLDKPSAAVQKQCKSLGVRVEQWSYRLPSLDVMAAVAARWFIGSRLALAGVGSVMIVISSIKKHINRGWVA